MIGRALGRGTAPYVLSGVLVLAILLAPWPRAAGTPGNERHVRIEAGESGFSPAVIEVQRGDRVTIELVSSDVAHGLHLDGYGVQVEADPGERGTSTFVADRPGVFRFRCSTTCGPLHPFMVGKVRVGRSELLWRGIGGALLVGLLALVAMRR